MQHLYKLYFQVLQGMRINCQSLEPGGKTRTVFHITLLPALRYTITASTILFPKPDCTFAIP